MMRNVQTVSRWAQRCALGLLWMVAALLMTGCGDAQSRAMKELKKKGYALELADFFKAAAAGDLAAMPVFLNAGMAADVRDGKGESALLHAIRSGQPSVVAFLLKEGVKLDGQALGAGELLRAAIRSKSEPTVALLLEKGITVPEAQGQESGLLTLAASVGADAIVTRLLPHVGEEKDAALLAAAASGDVTTVDVLLQAGASVFYRDPNTADTALHRAAAAGQAEVAGFLHRSGSNRYALNAGGQAALDLAIQSGHEAVASILSAAPLSDELEKGGKLRAMMADKAVIDLRSRILWQGRKLGELMSLRAVRQRRAPFALESISDGRAVFSKGAAGGEPRALGAGDLLEGFVIEQFRAYPAEASRNGTPGVVLRARIAGHLVLAAPGVTVRAGELCGLIELNGDDVCYEAHVGDKFTCISDGEVVYRIESVTPTGVLIKADKGEQPEISLRTGSVQGR